MSVSFQQHHALFGGSFNPPHFGHIEAVKGLFHHPKVSQVTLMPSFGTPLKEVSTPFQNRLEMTRLAFPDTTVSTFERDEKINYTWELLEKMSAKHSKLAFVIGTDQFKKIDQWNRFPDVLQASDWIVLLRKPETLLTLQSSIQKLVASGILSQSSDTHTFLINGGAIKRTLCFAETPAPTISSTKIRENFALGKHEEVKSLIPESVYQYIERNKLYGT